MFEKISSEVKEGLTSKLTVAPRPERHEGMSSVAPRSTLWEYHCHSVFFLELYSVQFAQLSTESLVFREVPAIASYSSKLNTEG